MAHGSKPDRNWRVRADLRNGGYIWTSPQGHNFKSDSHTDKPAEARLAIVDEPLTGEAELDLEQENENE